MKYVKLLFFLLSLVPQLLTADVQYGAFDPAYWNGLVILENDTAFAFRFVIHKGTDSADGYDTFHIIERVGPFAPDGSFAEVSFNPTLPFHKERTTPILKKDTPPSKLVKIRYSKFQKGVVGCISIPKDIEIETLFYNPWQPAVNFRNENNSIIGENSGLTFRFYPVDSLFEKVETKEKIVSTMVEKKVGLFYFYAGFDSPTLTGQKIERILEKSLEKYSAHRPKITGQWEGIIASITNNISWMRLYQPDRKRIYLPAGRRWIFPKPDGTRDMWTIFEWDAFFNALEAAVEDKKLAKKEIEAVLDTQYPNGNIPNWRSAHSGTPDRSQPPVGSFAVLKTYYRFNDISILKNSYPALKKWHQFWKAPGVNGNPRRDGNDDGLLEWGSDTAKLSEGMPKWEKNASGRQRAAWESGKDDLPNYDNIPFDKNTCTLKMNCIDLSSLYALDTEMMIKIASILGKKEDAKKYEKEYETLQEKINQQLWNRDFYFDRFWNGKFSTHKAASNFYTLVAGIPDEEQVDKLIGHLLSQKEFWGDYVIPTISRDNPAFKDQQYWRGTIWPPTNYLVYQGLKRYRQDKIASEFAIKSASLFLRSWQSYGLCRENYNSITGKGGGQRYQSWGPLFALILLEDFIDISPLDGFRVGNLSAAGENKIENIHLQGNVYTLEADNQGLLLHHSNTSKQLQKLFEFKGKAVLRLIEVSDDTIKFEANVIGDAMDFYPLIFSEKPFYVTSEGKKAIKMKDFIRIPNGITKIVLERARRTRGPTEHTEKHRNFFIF